MGTYPKDDMEIYPCKFDTYFKDTNRTYFTDHITPNDRYYALSTYMQLFLKNIWI